MADFASAAPDRTIAQFITRSGGEDGAPSQITRWRRARWILVDRFRRFVSIRRCASNGTNRRWRHAARQNLSLLATSNGALVSFRPSGSDTSMRAVASASLPDRKSCPRRRSTKWRWTTMGGCGPPLTKGSRCAMERDGPLSEKSGAALPSESAISPSTIMARCGWRRTPPSCASRAASESSSRPACVSNFRDGFWRARMASWIGGNCSSCSSSGARTWDAN